MDLLDKIDMIINEDVLSTDDMKKLRQSFIDMKIDKGIAVDKKGKVIYSTKIKTPESSIFMAIDKAGFNVTGEVKNGYTIKKR